MLLPKLPPPIHPPLRALKGHLQTHLPTNIKYKTSTKTQHKPHSSINPTISAILARRKLCTNDRQTSRRKRSSREPALLKEKHRQERHHKLVVVKEGVLRSHAVPDHLLIVPHQYLRSQGQHLHQNTYTIVVEENREETEEIRRRTESRSAPKRLRGGEPVVTTPNHCT